MSMNQIVLMGRITKDPDLRMTQTQKAVVNFTLAVDRDYTATGEQRQTDFIDCVSFGSTADFIHKWFYKGAMALVSGRLQLRDWTDKDGNKRRQAEVLVDRVYFGEAKKKEEKPAQGFQEINEDSGTLPF